MKSVTGVGSVTLVVLALNAPVAAQQIPDAGSQSRSLQPTSPPPPLRSPNLSVQPAPDAQSPGPAGGERIAVRVLRFTGNAAFGDGELIQATGFTPGSQYSVADLRALAERITAHYRSRGFLVARAVLPPQEIRDGIVLVSVLEGSYDKITLRNSTNLSAAIPKALLDDVQEGAKVQAPALERLLLRLSDLPGVTVRSTLQPGASVGTSELVVDVAPGKVLTGEVQADNHGSRYTGESRLGLNLNANNLAGLGDVASVRVLTSGNGLNYGRVAWQGQFGAVRGGVAYSDMRYRLGRDFAPLEASGNARIASAFGSYPILRSRNDNLNLTIAHDAKKFQDRIDLTATHSTKTARVTMIGLSGAQLDDWSGGGVSNYSLTWTTGRLSIESALAKLADAAGPMAHGTYQKLAFTVARQQRLPGPFSLSVALAGQFASKNLDASEKLSLGGANGVRAYPEGEAQGDTGLLVNAELRAAVPQWAEFGPGQLQLAAFVDHGTVQLNRNPYLPTRNRRTLGGAGLGLIWNVEDLTLRAYYARKIGDEAAQSAPDAGGRFWASATKLF